MAVALKVTGLPTAPAAGIVRLVMVTTDAVATWTGAPLLWPSVVTMAVKLPAVIGGIENATVREVVVAAVTRPGRRGRNDER